LATKQPADLAEATARAITLAEEEARRNGAAYLRSYHLLLGLLAEGTGRAAEVLRGLGLTLERTRAAAAARFGPEAPSEPAALGRTPRAKLAIAAAAEAAARLRSPRIETEHLLLALVQDEHGRGGAAQVLRDLGIEAGQVRSRLTEGSASGDA
jgi:ATP-dependent Clp protease ATP-binding subunit ClpC